LTREVNRRNEEYLVSLIQKLLAEPSTYFSNGYLNSEGWKVLLVIRRLVIRNKPYLARRIKSINHQSSYEEVVRVLTSLLKSEFNEECEYSCYS